MNKKESNSTTRTSDNDPVRKFYNDSDDKHWKEIESLIQSHGFTTKDILKHYPALIQRRDLPRILAHYELFKLIKDLPGSIIELGVFMGSGFFTWANLLETFCPGDRVRKVFGFDDFEGYSKFSSKDAGAAEFVNRHHHQLVSNETFIKKLTQLHNDDNLLKGVERCRIICGNITETVPDFVENNKGLRLSMLYLDANIYDPTITGLKYLYPLVVPGGVVVFNAYGQNPWEGEARAIEEYFSEINVVPEIKKFSFSTIPSCYFIKKGF